VFDAALVEKLGVSKQHLIRFAVQVSSHIIQENLKESFERKFYHYVPSSSNHAVRKSLFL